MQNNKINVLFLIAILLFSLVIRLPFIDVPLERDEGVYAYIAQRISRGELPYRDIFDHKPPGIYYIYWLAFKTLGEGHRDIHLFMYLYILIEILLIYKLTLMLFNNRVIGLISVLIFSIFTAGSSVAGFTANTEIFMLLPIIGSIIIMLLALQKKKMDLFFVCGVLNGMAFMIKQVAIFDFLFIFVFLLYIFIQEKEPQLIKKLIKSYTYLMTGFIVIFVPIFFYFWLNGAGYNFIHGVFLYNLGYVGAAIYIKNILFKFFKFFIPILKQSWPFWFLFLYTFIYSVKKIQHLARGNKIFYLTKMSPNILLIGWFLFSFLGVSSGLRFFPHYFLQIAPSLTINAGFGFFMIVQKINKIQNIFLRKISPFLIISLVFLIPLGVNYKYFFVYSSNQIARRLYGSSASVEAEDIADYIKQNSSLDDTIAIVGSEAEILFYAKRKSATKHIIFYTLTRNYDKKALINQKEFIQEITREKPKYIVIVNIYGSLGVKLTDKMYVLDKLYELLKSHYYLDGIVLIAKDKSLHIFGKDKIKLFVKHAYLTDIPPILIYTRKDIKY